MKLPLRMFGHQVHPMLVGFPLALLTMSVVFDAVALYGDRPAWGRAAALLVAAGLITGVLTAVTGLVDWLGIPAVTRAKRVGLVHAGANAVALGLFLASWVLRAPEGDPRPASLAVAFVGLIVLSVGGWLGGELVERFGLGVADDAGLNAPGTIRLFKEDAGER